MQFPILEFDRDAEALIEPTKPISPRVVPEACVPCFGERGSRCERGGCRKVGRRFAPHI